jgi:hypothetical protein
VNDWHREPPPPDAYSGVTNRERFLPLHARTLELIDRLRAGYRVTETSAFSLLPGMHRFDAARPPVALTPARADAAPIAIAFTTFPSLIVRFGRWLVDSFPSCGCDACAETAEREGERLEELLEAVATQHFYEQLTIPLFGHARLRWKLGSPEIRASPHGESLRTLPRAEARLLRGAGPGRVAWQPWPARG